MEIPTIGFWLPKAGNSELDYEDAYAMRRGRIAIADGATELSFARRWALELVQGWTGTSLPAVPASLEEFRENVSAWQQTWHHGIAWDRLPWFAEEKARSGAFAALLGFEVQPPTSPEADAEWHWSAFAIGDTCLFQIRDRQVILAFPLDRSKDFDNRPLLLSSNPARNETVWDQVAYQEGTCQYGDLFVFATDALARWFLTEVEAGEQPWHMLAELNSQTEFAAFITELRRSQQIRNDDVTLILAYAAPGPEDEAEISRPAESQDEMPVGDATLVDHQEGSLGAQASRLHLSASDITVAEGQEVER